MNKSKEQDSLIIDHSLNETQYNNVPKSSRVFISYSHDSNKHEECVLQLSNRLRDEGIDCNIDQYEDSPPEGWFRWMINQIEEANYVLIVCTENYEKRFKGKEEAGKGLGAKWEGAIITQELYDSEANNKCIPIVFYLEDLKYIPSILKDVTYYNLEEDYIKLYSRLTGQKLIEKPAIGKLREITSESQSPKIPETFTSSSTGMEFILIPAGKFMMGAEDVVLGKPVHGVTIKYSFYMGIYPVTQNQWIALMDSNPSEHKREDLPVEHVSWDDVQRFIKKLNEIEGTDKYRLPSEAEWEYACRAGTTTKYSFGDDDSRLKEYAWYYKNSGSETHPVAQKKPNLWGLYDMYGNVWEWIQDRFHSNYVGAPSDGSAWEDGDSSVHMIRGGSYKSGNFDCRSADCDSASSNCNKLSVGFRLVREL